MNSEIFFRRSIEQLLMPGKKILDVGSGLRVDPARGNVVDPTRAWIKPLLKGVEYLVMDPVDTYHPDIVGDLMQAPLENASFDGIICLAVLEHVPRAWDAAHEMYRILKPGGLLLGYVPFLSPYHAMPGYYGDYVRFTDDGVRALFSDFTSIEVQGVRGPVETLLHLLPRSFKKHWTISLAQFVDRRRASSGKQASGYFFFCVK